VIRVGIAARRVRVQASNGANHDWTRLEGRAADHEWLLVKGNEYGIGGAAISPIEQLPASGSPSLGGRKSSHRGELDLRPIRHFANCDELKVLRAAAASEAWCDDECRRK